MFPKMTTVLVLFILLLSARTTKGVENTCNSADGDAACTDPNAFCQVFTPDGQGICNCREGYYLTENVTCVAPGSQQGGTNQICKTSQRSCDNSEDVCASSLCKRKAGGSCSQSEDVCTFLSTCVSNKCTCNSPFVASDIGLCESSKGHTGELCRSTEPACYDTQDICYNSVCMRKLGAACGGEDGGVCAPPAYCASSVCSCLPSYVASNSGTCVSEEGLGKTKENCRLLKPYCDNTDDICDSGVCMTRVGGNCSKTPDGCVTEASCINDVCTCLSPWQHDGQGRCEKGPDVGPQEGRGGTKQPCKSSKPSCNSPDNECLYYTCVTLLGKNCSVTPDGCTPMAECVSGVCTCISPFVDSGFGHCIAGEKQAGGPCYTWEGDKACNDENAYCDTLGEPGARGICYCKDGFQPTPQATCVEETRLVGGGCSLKDGHFACRDENAECRAVAVSNEGGGVCACRNGFVSVGDGSCKLSAGSTTAECVNEDKCNSSNDTCIMNTCKTRVKGSCTDDRQCVPNAHCDANFRCECIPPYTSIDGFCQAPAGKIFGECNPQKNGSCEDPKAKCVGQLDRGQCLCKDPYYHTDQLTCQARPRTLNGLCDVGLADACDDVNAECTYDMYRGKFVCSCKEDYSETVDYRCLPSLEVGFRDGVCAVSGKCYNPSETCSHNYCKIPAGGECPINSHSCAFGASCVGNKCTCQKGFSQVDGKCYRIFRTLGNSCNLSEGDNACADPLAQCVKTGNSVIGVCVCGNSAEDGTCSSTSISVSLLLLGITFILSRAI